MSSKTRIKFSNSQLEEIIKLYTELQWSSTKIGKKYGCSFSPIERVLQEQGIEIKKNKEKTKYQIGDIVGNGFTLIERIERKNNGKTFICLFKCPYCQKTFKADLYNVANKNGRYWSCGCKKKDISWPHSPTKDLTGQKINKLTVIKLSDKTTPHPNGGHFIYWDCLCECGNYTTVSTSHLKSGHTTSCGKCCISKGEDKIKKVLENLSIKFIQQYRFTDCRDKNPLPFDFYLPDFNCCIEYDGEQHYKNIISNKKSTFFTKEAIDKIIHRDKIKDKYCSQNNIGLIKIPYFDFEKINEEYIGKALEENACGK